MIALDKNCNGYIDYSEFLVAAADKNRLVNQESLKMCFDLIDKDGSQLISKPELKKVFENTEQKDEEMWTSIFAEVDLNKDGFISYEEFYEHMTKIIK